MSVVASHGSWSRQKGLPLLESFLTPKKLFIPKVQRLSCCWKLSPDAGSLAGESIKRTNVEFFICRYIEYNSAFWGRNRKLPCFSVSTILG